MKFIGHRGASHVVPENTVAAVRTALSVGCGFEIDLQLLRDGTLIVLHDDTLERTAAPDAHTSGLMRSPITSLRLPDVAGVDVGSWFGADFADERPPLFADVLRELRRSYSVPGSVHAHCFAELKGDRPHDPALPGIAAAAVAEMRVPPATLTWISSSLPSAFARSEQRLRSHAADHERMHVPFVLACARVLLEMKAICPQYRALYIADARTADAAWRAARASVGARLDGVDLRVAPEEASHLALHRTRTHTHTHAAHTHTRWPCALSCVPRPSFIQRRSIIIHACMQAHPDVVTAELCEWMHARGKLVAVRVSKAPAKEDTVEMYEAMERHGVDFFTSNLPPVLHTWRRRRQRTSEYAATPPRRQGGQTHMRERANSRRARTAHAVCMCVCRAPCASSVRMVAKTAAGMGAGFATALAASGDVRLSEDLVDLAQCVAPLTLAQRVARKVDSASLRCWPCTARASLSITPCAPQPPA
jgi:hypothetical protein